MSKSEEERNERERSRRTGTGGEKKTSTTIPRGTEKERETEHGRRGRPKRNAKPVSEISVKNSVPRLRTGESERVGERKRQVKKRRKK